MSKYNYGRGPGSYPVEYANASSNTADSPRPVPQLVSLQQDIYNQVQLLIQNRIQLGAIKQTICPPEPETACSGDGDQKSFSSVDTHHERLVYILNDLREENERIAILIKKINEYV